MGAAVSGCGRHPRAAAGRGSMRPRWLCQRQRHAELDEEIRSHLALAEADRIARGESPNEAAHAAQREFGNVSLVKEITREMWGGWWLERLIQDVQYAMRAGFRSLKRTPGFTTTVFLTLAVGIGASTAVFSVVNHVLIQPLPYAEAERLTRIYQFDLDDDEKFVTAVAYKAYRQQLSACDDVAALYTYRETGRDLVDAAGSQRIRVLPVSHEYFRVLRAQPVLGRGIAPEEETPDARVVVLSERIWRMRYASAPTAIGQTLNLSGETFMVIGVAPSELEDPVAGAIDAWVPLDLRPGDGRDHPDNHSLTVIGRLADGAGFALARAQIQGLDAQLAERYPEAADNQTRMVGLHEDVVGNA